MTALRKGLDEAFKEWSTRQDELDDSVESLTLFDTDSQPRELKILKEQKRKIQFMQQQMELCIQASRKLRLSDEKLSIMGHEQYHKRLEHNLQTARINLHLVQVESETKLSRYANRVRSIEEMEVTPDHGNEYKIQRLLNAEDRMIRHYTRYQARIHRKARHVKDLQDRVHESARSMKDWKRAWEHRCVIDT